MSAIARASRAGAVLASKGHYGARFRSLFGDVPVRVRRLLVCPCQNVIEGGAKSFAALDFGKDGVAPELAYVTARYAALVPISAPYRDILKRGIAIFAVPSR